MSFPRLVVRLLLVFAFCFAAATVSVAQTPPIQPMCVEGCNDWSVSVKPDGTVLSPVPVQTGFHKVTYTVLNNGNNADTYSYSCSGTNGVVCDSVKPHYATIPANSYAKIWQRPTAYYHVGGSAGNGTIKVTASGEATDYGTYVVPIYIPQGAPVVSLAPHNGVYRKVGQCVASCFDMVWSHSTVPYFSLGQARSLTLVYNSSTVKPTPVASMDVHVPAGNSPTHYSVQVKRVSTGAFLTLLNGGQTVWYTAQGTNVVRLAAAIDAQANGLGTGAYDIEVAVTAHYGNGPVTTSVFTRLIVVDRTGPYGEGVDLAGIQHLYIQPDGSALITEGDGSASFYEYENGLPFHTPAGATDRLTSPSGTYRRTAMDGSYIEFNSAGRMNKAVDRFGNTTTLYYDTSGRLDRIRDPMGKELDLTYLTSGKLGSVKDPGNRITTYTVTNNRLVTVKDPDNVSTTLAYNTATNQVTGITDRGGHLTSITYDAIARIDTVKAPSITLYTGSAARPTTVFKSADRITWQPGTAGTSAGNAKPSVLVTAAEATITDPQGAVTRFRLDRFGAATTVTDILGKVTTISRDTMSRVTFVTEPNGHQSQFTWSNGNEPPAFSPYLLLKVKDVTTSRTQTFTYTAAGDVATVDGGAAVTIYTYHTGGQWPAGALKSVSVGGPTVTHWPDSRGRDTLVVHEDTTHRVRYHYETVWGNQDWVIDPRGSKTMWHYDDLGRVDTTTVPLSGKSVVTYGLLNQVLTGKDPLLQVTQNTYNTDGMLTRVTDPKGQVYKFVYNALGDLVARHDLGDTTKADTLKYDIMGNVRTARTRRGDVINMTYDVAGRMLTRSGPDFPTDTYRYDPAGRWMVATNAIAYDSLNYDAAGRMVRSFQKINGKTWQWNYTYDIHNRLYQRSDAAGQHGFYRGWSTGGGLGSVSATDLQMQFVRTSAESLAVKREFGNPAGNGWTARRAVTTTHSDSTIDYPDRAALNAAFGVAFRFDSLNRLVSKKYNGKPKRQFTYDALGRLTNACDSIGSSCINLWGGIAVPYKYDATGNRLAAGELFANVGAGNRIHTTLGWYFNYDANGNLVSKCTGAVYCGVYTQHYTWDALGRLKKIMEGTGNLIDSMGYDAFGRRVRKTTASGTEWYVYDGEHVAFDVNNSNVIKTEYGYYPGTDALYTIRNPSWTGVALTDPRIGSVIGWADTMGNMRKHYDTKVWGSVAADTGVLTRHRMAGREYDQESGLYYMRARYYDPETGRFLSEDPIGIAGGLNLYVYAANNPLNLRDPLGMDPECPKDGSPARRDDGTFCLASITAQGHRDFDRLSGRPFIMAGIPGGYSGGMGLGGKGGGGGSQDGAGRVQDEASLKTCNRVLIAVTCFVLGPGKGWVDQLKGFPRPPFTEISEPYPLNAEKRAFEEMLKNRRPGLLSRFLLKMPLLILVVPSEAICLPTIGLTPACSLGNPEII